MRRGDLLLAEGAGRGGGSRHVDSFAACGRPSGKLRAAAAAAEDFSHDQEGQTRSGVVRRRDHQHALAARHRGLSRRAEMGGEHRRSCSTASSRERQCASAYRMGGADALGGFSGIRCGDSQQYQRLPEGGRRTRDFTAGSDPGGVCEESGGGPGEGGRGARCGIVSVRAAGFAHLVWRHDRAKRRAIADAVARLGICNLLAQLEIADKGYRAQSSHCR